MKYALTLFAASLFALPAGAQAVDTYKTSTQANMDACVSLCQSTYLCGGVSFLQPDSRFDEGECKMTIKPERKPADWDLQTALSELNTYRAGYGLKPVTLSDTLNAASQIHSDDMADMEDVSHEGSDGQTHDKRIKRLGYNFRYTAENVAGGQFSWNEVFKAWQDSPGHNKNLLAPEATELGIALTWEPKTEFRTYWTMVLAAPLG